MILGKKKASKKDPSPSPLTPHSMESEDIDPTTVIFNQPLPIAARRSDHVWGAIPSPVRLTVDWLNKKGLSEEGIYRVPGKATTFATYKALFDRGVDFDFFELHEMAPENVAMVLIKYLQALPDPIYCAKFEGHFRIALGIANEQERASVMRGIMYMIPMPYRETCRVLVEHLRLVSGNSDVNKMTLRNVELTWSLSVGQMTGAIVRVLSESPLPVPSTLQYQLPLETAAENAPRELTNTTPTVPYAVSTLISWLHENDGFSQSCLFSTESKNQEILDDIIYVLNGGSLGVDNKFPEETTAWDVANCLKQWIAEIPGDAGLFPDSMRPDFVRVIPPTGATGKNINFAEMPDKLEPLIWKLPDVHLDTIKALLGMLHLWTTVAPEDITALQAVELLFPAYSTPLQHALAYILFNYDSMFGTEDSALSAHLQSLVFASPSGPNNIGRLGSPLSPQHAKLGNAATQTSSTATNSSTPSSSNSSAPTAPGGENTQSAGERSDATTSPGTPGTPSKAYKKSKTLKGTSSPVSAGKVKKHREAEDDVADSPSGSKSRSGTRTPKSSTPKSSKSERNGSPTKRTKSSSTPPNEVEGDKPRSRHSKSASADPEATVKQKHSDSTTDSGDASPSLGTPTVSEVHSRSASSDAIVEATVTTSSSKKSKSRESSIAPVVEGEEKPSTPTTKKEKKSKSVPPSAESTTSSPLESDASQADSSDTLVQPTVSETSSNGTTPKRSKSPAVPAAVAEEVEEAAIPTKKKSKKDSSKGSTDEASEDRSKGSRATSPGSSADDKPEEVEAEAGSPSDSSSPANVKTKKRKSVTVDPSIGALEKTDKKRDRRKSKGPPSDPILDDSGPAPEDSTLGASAANDVSAEPATESPKKARKQTPVEDPSSVASPKKSLKIKVSTPAVETK